MSGGHAPEADVLTPDQERWLSGRLWAELRHGLYRDGRHAWDASLTPKREQQKYVAVKCGRCNGKGAIASFSIRYSGKCFACDGSGVRYISRAAYAKRVAIAKANECQYCEGTGADAGVTDEPREHCAPCDGTGVAS